LDENIWRKSKRPRWISFLTSAGIPIHLDMFANDEPLNNALGRRDQ